MAILNLSQNKIVLIDDEDFERVNQFKWCYLANYGASKHITGYAARSDYTNGKKTIYLHKFLLNPPVGLKVDHINGNGLDCRKENLRIATVAQNCFNRAIAIDSTSGFKGVYWKPAHKKFVASITVQGKQKHLGLFNSAVDAAMCYDRHARLYYGDFAAVNFPAIGERQC
ncbi:MAG: HNH endonuclease [Acidobacteria bacterium]|nr:HNH endonuclease [Acidobacteriota bacterium]